MDSLVIAVEGTCGAGKTTLISGLYTQLGELGIGIGTAPDYGEMLTESELPAAAPETVEEELDAIELFLQVEAERVRQLRPSKERKVTLLDRSVFTLLAHVAGLDRALHNEPPWLPQIENIIATDWRSLLPSYIFYLDLPPEHRVSRIAGRIPSCSILMDQEFNIGFSSYFSRLSSTSHSNRLQWMDATRRPSDVLSTALTTIHHLLALPK